jgi:large subunit ribosomal protein L33
MLFKLVSSAGTGYFYVGEKKTIHAARRLILRKYDPIVNMHVLFHEHKLKSPKKK